MKLYAFGVLNGVDEVLHEVVSLVGTSELRLGLHLVGEDIIIDLLLSSTLALQLILLFKFLVGGGIADGLGPLALA